MKMEKCIGVHREILDKLNILMTKKCSSCRNKYWCDENYYPDYDECKEKLKKELFVDYEK